MFFSESELTLELLGIYKIHRDNLSRQSTPERSYDSLSARISGQGTLRVEKKTYTLQRGDLLYIPQNTNYYQQTQRETIIAIHFICHGNYQRRSLEVIHVEDVEKIEELLLEMERIWAERKQGYQYRCTAMLYQLLYFTNKHAYQQKINTEYKEHSISKAIDYIHKHFRDEQISISKLAELTFTSETYFRKIFKNNFNMSPVQYINNLKLEYAAQLLQSQLYTVVEVSRKAGYADVKYFSRSFKKKFGSSPMVFKKGC